MFGKIKDIHVNDHARGQEIHIEFSNGWNQLTVINTDCDRFYLAAAFRAMAAVIESNEGVDAFGFDVDGNAIEEPTND